MITIRQAEAADLPAILGVFYTNELDGEEPPPVLPPMVPDYPHVLQTGSLFVAEQEGKILGFAGTVVRSDIAFLTDLFVDPHEQSSGIGGQLLREAFAPHQARLRFTVSSTDARALNLYIRAGLQPYWPNFLVRTHKVDLARLPETDLIVHETQPLDTELIEWDAAIGGRFRPEDHAYWCSQEGSVPLWFERSGTRIGYAHVRLKAGTIWYPNAARVGPIGARTPEDAALCAIAAVRWAATRAPILRLDVPGPHPALRVLLEAGFRISYVETIHSSATPCFDPHCYIGSGGSLF